MADLLFAKHTSKILNALPHWFKERKGSADSVGARFLNITGLQLDDIQYVIDYAYNQCYIDKADLDQVDFCYKVIVPMPLRVKDITEVIAGNTELRKAESIKEFFGIDINTKNKGMYSFQTYFVDEKRNILYVRNRFNVDAVNDDGKITFTITNKQYTRPLVPHKVWNFFDEFGALVSCPRLYKESNAEYKKRILDVFKNPANASLDGLINGIGRELSIRRTVTWVDPTKELELEDPMIVINSIKVNEEYYNLSNIWISSSGTIVLRPDKDSIEKNAEVSYVYGLEMHQLYNKDDIKFYNELFTVEGKPKERLLRYIDILNGEAPIFWNDFHWNEHYWDQNNEDVSGTGFIPNLMNGSIRGFKNYKG